MYRNPLLCIKIIIFCIKIIILISIIIIITAKGNKNDAKISVFRRKNMIIRQNCKLIVVLGRKRIAHGTKRKE